MAFKMTSWARSNGFTVRMDPPKTVMGVRTALTRNSFWDIFGSSIDIFTQHNNPSRAIAPFKTGQHSSA
jgi:hypothetical protein